MFVRVPMRARTLDHTVFSWYQKAWKKKHFFHKEPNMHFRNPDMLLFMGMADACGMGAEFVEKEKYSSHCSKVLSLEGYCGNPKYSEYQAGRYTDDTEMSVANAKVLTKEGVNGAVARKFAEAYINEFERGGRRHGYSRHLRQVLLNARTPEDLLRGVSGNSTGNGAAMRAVPLGVIPDIPTCMRIAGSQASLTHSTQDGIWSARMVALMSHYALYEKTPLQGLTQFCEEHLSKEDRTQYGEVFKTRYSGAPVMQIGSLSLAFNTTHAVLELLTNRNSLLDMLRTALQWGGDTDTVAAVTWGIASARYRQEKLPAWMLRDLEKGMAESGPEYLKNIGRHLMQTFAPAQL